MAAGFNIDGSHTILGKNALWAAIATTIAASCLFAAVMDRESAHTISTTAFENQVDKMVEKTVDVIEYQEKAAENFLEQVRLDLVAAQQENAARCLLINAKVSGTVDQAYP